jgi:hypothetical protein
MFLKNFEYNISCHNGLCNRLRFLFSWLHKAKETNSVLNVEWKKTDGCDCYFLDLFKPIKNVFFFEEIDKIKYNFKHCVPHPDYKPNDKYIYEDLKLNDTILDEIKTLYSDKYNSIHIRTTDLFETYDNNLFCDFIEKSNLKVFISTDSSEIQKKYKNIFNSKIFFYEDIEDLGKLRQTSIRHSVIDLFTCINSVEFLGTNQSSFSDFIKDNRKWTKNEYLKKVF